MKRKNTDNLYELSCDSITAYLNGLKKYDITKEQEIEYFNKIKAGDKEAKDEFIEKNLRLVVATLKEYAAKSELDFLDIIQAGNMGLMSAVERFDPAKGYKFSTYATWWIKRLALNMMTDQRTTVRLPRYKMALAYKINRLEDELSKKYGREPTENEIINELGITEEQYRDLKTSQINMVSLNSLLRGEKSDPYDDGESFLNSSVRVENMIESEEDNPEVSALEKEKEDLFNNYLKSTLTERELLIIKLRFGLNEQDPLTLEEIGNSLNISRERVRQLESRALDKLRASSKAKTLTDYITEDSIEKAKQSVKTKIKK